MPEQKELSPVERAAKHVEFVKAQLARVIGFGPFDGKGKAIVAVRRELAQAESALETAKKAAVKAAPAETAVKTAPVK